MTNEKAITILEMYKQRLVNSVSIGLEKDIEAYEVAICALKNEQTDGDLISRTDLLKELEKWDWQELYLPIHFKELVDELPSANKTDGDLISRNAVLDLVADYNLSMGQVVKGIHALPTVTPQPSVEKTAEWIFVDNKKIIAKCSNCTLLHDTMYGTRYCPNCGARMGVEQ